MRITREQRKRLIERVVYDHFIPKINVEVARLVIDTTTKSLKNYELSKLFGSPITVEETPAVFHIGAISKNLVNNLIILLDEENDYTLAKKENTETRRLV